jgi:hypothetical protein
MTLIRPIETKTAVIAAEELLEGLYLRTASALETLALRVEAGEFPDLSDTKKIAASLREQEAYVLKERERSLAQRKTDAGLAGDFAIDFEAVKCEIGRKLDNLRTS